MWEKTFCRICEYISSTVLASIDNIQGQTPTHCVTSSAISTKTKRCFDNRDNTEDLPINISSNVPAARKHTRTDSVNSSAISTTNKRYSNNKDTGNKKKIQKHNIKQLFEQHTSDYCNSQNRILQLKEEQLAVAKEEFEFQKKVHQEHIELLISLVDRVNELTNIIRSIAPQYLEDSE